jgi:signal transduction histidine kinase
VSRTLATPTSHDLGRLVAHLRPALLEHQGLWAALEWAAQEFIDHTGLEGDLRVVVGSGVAAPRGEWADAVLALFEAVLSNVASHARAQRVHIRISVDDPGLYVEVRDDGIGLSVEQQNDPASCGIAAMREQVARFGGRLSFESAPLQGTRVRLVMPLLDGLA